MKKKLCFILLIITLSLFTSIPVFAYTLRILIDVMITLCDEYVDWVGVNIYNVIYHNNDINDPADHEDPLELLDYVYNIFSDRKPIQISEYAATHYTTTDDTEYVAFAIEKITRLYSGIIKMYPRVKAIFYFNSNNLINAPSGRRINDY